MKSVSRHKTKVIKLGGVAIGGNNPVSIQSMTKTDTRDVRATVKQIKRLEDIGCEIIRVAVPDAESARALAKIRQRITIPLVADIHFNWRLAVAAMENGAQGIRINPGNLGQGLTEVVKAARKKKVPIRVGVNSGSLDNKYTKVTEKALAASALGYIQRIEDLGYRQLKISVKAPDIKMTIAAYRLLAEKTNYPLHLGLTEAGTLLPAAVRSSAALGALLMDGIGDTIRISVTGDPEQEVLIARELLQSLGLRKFGPQIISCPTCARCQVDLVKIVNDLEKKLAARRVTSLRTSPKVAVMGCVVNGPGEAREADIGIACGRGKGVLFRNGRQIGTVREREIVKSLLKEI